MSRALDEKSRIDARLARIQEMTSLLAQGLSATEVAQVILEQGTKTLGAQMGIVVCKPKDESRIEVLATYNYPPEFIWTWKTATITRDLPIIHTLRTETETFLETSQEILDKFPLMKTLVNKGARSVVALPLKLKDRTIAAVGFTFSKSQRFNEETRSFMRLMMSQCAQSLERAFLFDRERELKESFQTALRARDEFLSIASHELKTPITTLKLQLGILKHEIQANRPEGSLSPRITRGFDLAHSQINRITSLINDMLDIARIRGGKLKFEFSKTSLLDLVNETLERFAEPLAGVNSKVEVRVPESLSGNWDRNRLEQVLTNLLSNAVKYAPGSPILIQAKEEGQKARISVQDFGPGIPHDKKKLIFEKFERASYTPEISGLGLGLFISKQIVAGHQGKIWVESQTGKGATFIIELPLEPRTEGPTLGKLSENVRRPKN